MSQKIVKIHPAVRTPYRCPNCATCVEFEKVDINREDGAFDWYLNVVCMCGEVTDKDTVEACYDMHWRLSATELKRQQNEAFANALGEDLADSLQRIAGDGL